MTPLAGLRQLLSSDIARPLFDAADDRFEETLSQLMVIQFAGAGAWLLWATTIGTDTVLDSPWSWLLPALGAAVMFAGGSRWSHSRKPTDRAGRTA
jgi:hypothetical protein